jgi:hypothetical protein
VQLRVHMQFQEMLQNGSAGLGKGWSTHYVSTN